MRGSTHDMTFIGTDGEVQGVSLGWDFVSEHEWGIKELQAEFGTDPNTGLISECPTEAASQYDPYLKLTREGNTSVLAFSSRHDGVDSYRELRVRGDKGMGAAWSSRDFAIIVKDDEEGHEWLKEIHDAFLRKDIRMGFSRMDNNPFGNSCLVFLIHSRMQ